MSLMPGISGQSTVLMDGVKVDSISENTNGNGIIASLSCYATGGGAGSCCCTYLVNGSGTVFNKHRTTSTDGHFIPAVLAWIDSPNTTSPVTYKVQLSTNQYVGGTATINQDPVYESSTLLVEEIL